MLGLWRNLIRGAPLFFAASASDWPSEGRFWLFSAVKRDPPDYPNGLLPFASSRAMGAKLRETLEQFTDHPLVGKIDVTGLMAGIELVKDKDSGEVYPAETKIATRIGDASQRHGLLHRAMGNRIAFAPAYVISEEEIGEIGVRLGKALDEVHGGLT